MSKRDKPSVYKGLKAVVKFLTITKLGVIITKLGVEYNNYRGKDNSADGQL